jgi:endonuclease YncB( thermonuclease family)
VVGVADGDTITVLRGGEQVEVRLADIDAPEKAQPFGNRSKQALERSVKVWRATFAGDRYTGTVPGAGEC